MILKKEVQMIFPSRDLGQKIAKEDAKTQCNVLIGFADKQLMDCVPNNQPIISLVALMPVGLIWWFVRIYQEIVRQGKCPKKVDEDISAS